MSIIEAVNDVSNQFLSRREITCNFAGLGGKLKKLEATEMVTKEFKLNGKLVIPIRLQNHVGKPMVTGTFYIYDDEKIARQQVNSVIFTRLEKAKKKKTAGEDKEQGESAEEEKKVAAPPDEPKDGTDKAKEKTPQEKNDQKDGGGKNEQKQVSASDSPKSPEENK